ncbi:hypothetical protein D9756_009152 [Leucocoprinus leucothites]|uniref:G domain-containing protein n=1 Tax=Leucocoprinus leucothites TaxID=201217 RepID=A0A8H5CY43_9AGAR|nr:hypothetical protein D9756_009152 [Leucoagaricus leucothites]
MTNLFKNIADYTWTPRRGGTSDGRPTEPRVSAQDERQSASRNSAVHNRGNVSRSSASHQQSSLRQEPQSRPPAANEAREVSTQASFVPTSRQPAGPQARVITPPPQTQDHGYHNQAPYPNQDHAPSYPTNRQQTGLNVPEGTNISVVGVSELPDPIKQARKSFIIEVPRLTLLHPDDSMPNRHYQRRPREPKGPLFRKIQADSPRSIVIFGETGTGKSSLINMLSDNEVAKVSNLAVGCTFESAPHPITVDGVPYTLWDTAGLNEGDSGSVPADIALNHLRDLVDKLHDGLSLLVYCIRGARYRDILKVNYDLFREIICQGEVPIVIVVTGLENEEWHACVTTTKGKRNMFEEEYEDSKTVLRELIQEKCPPDAWVINSDAWLQRITTRIQEYYDDYNGYSSMPTEAGGGQLPVPSLLRSFIGTVLPLISRQWLSF